MEILTKKSNAKFELANLYRDKDNNICAASLYFSAFQECKAIICLFLEKEKNIENNSLYERIIKILSNANIYDGSHAKKIKALKLISRKKIDYFASKRFDIKMNHLGGIRVIADYDEYKNVDDDQIKSAFQAYKEVKKIFSKLKNIYLL